MNRLFTFVSYLLIVAGLFACIGGIVSANLTPLVLGGILIGLGGILLHLVRLERRLTEALPALKALSQTARFLALKEPHATRSAADADPSLDRAGVRDGAPGAVGIYPERGHGAAARP